MEIRKDYCIVQETIAIYPWMDPNGNFYSLVIEGYKKIQVQMSPFEIIEYSLLSYGSSLKGAIKASKFHLGRKNMVPIKISYSIGFYWFPTCSIKNPDCVWLAERHIEKVTKINDYNTLINLSHGHVFTIKMKEKYVWSKIHRARDLRFIIENRKQIEFVYTKKIGFQIVKEATNMNYTITEK